MKLAEALLLRTEYQQKVESLQRRILSNIKIQEGENPTENPDELLKEILLVNEQLADIIVRINKTNNNACISNGKTIAEALVERDMIMKKRSILSDIVDEANQKDYRLSHSEVKMHVSIDIAEIQKMIDKLSKQYRQLDTEIQSVNWTTDIQQ